MKLRWNPIRRMRLSPDLNLHACLYDPVGIKYCRGCRKGMKIAPIFLTLKPILVYCL